MNYIPVDKLIAEIEKALKASELHRGEAAVDGSRQTLYWIKDFIVSHQYQKPKDTWKPSKEQIEALKHCVDGCQDIADGVLESLYNDLKKLT